jgi:RNA polymerase sigma-70 factor (ECF subfamily)
MLQTGIVNKDESIQRTRQWVPADVLQQEWLEIQAAIADRTQFRPLYERYFEQVFRFIFHRTADEALAADICSQVFLKAMQRLDSYSFQGLPLSAWLYRIAQNEIRQYYRAANKNRVVSAEDAQLHHLAEEVEEGTDAAQLHQALLIALDELDPADMELVEMRFFEERPFKEIAEILGISEANAKMRTYRILEKMKRKMLNPKTKENRDT